jgi:TatA/E family protein of Tat protein translocase
MFGLGMPEILLILAIALMVIGPKKLPELAKTLGRAMGEFKNAAQDFKRSIDLEGTTREFSEPVQHIKNDIKSAVNPMSENSTDHQTADTAEKTDRADKKSRHTSDSLIDADFKNAEAEPVHDDKKAGDPITSDVNSQHGEKA